MFSKKKSFDSWLRFESTAIMSSAASATQMLSLLIFALKLFNLEFSFHLRNALSRLHIIYFVPEQFLSPYVTGVIFCLKFPPPPPFPSPAGCVQDLRWLLTFRRLFNDLRWFTSNFWALLLIAFYFYILSLSRNRIDRNFYFDFTFKI